MTVTVELIIPILQITEAAIKMQAWGLQWFDAKRLRYYESRGRGRQFFLLKHESS
jgi:hypothetical protein